MNAFGMKGLNILKSTRICRRKVNQAFFVWSDGNTLLLNRDLAHFSIVQKPEARNIQKKMFKQAIDAVDLS